jgi:hypothetical protein
VAGVIGRGLAVGLGVGLGVGVGDGVASPALLVRTVALGIGGGVASPALLVRTVVLGVFEQATTASATKKIEPIRARRPVRTLVLPNRFYRGRTETPHPLLLF